MWGNISTHIGVHHTHGFLSWIKATSGGIEDICLGKPYFNGSTMIPKTNADINIRALPVGPYQLIIVCYD
jgi:hypothetical protein